jgi:hypothetical protein
MTERRTAAPPPAPSNRWQHLRAQSCETMEGLKNGFSSRFMFLFDNQLMTLRGVRAAYSFSCSFWFSFSYGDRIGVRFGIRFRVRFDIHFGIRFRIHSGIHF